MTLWQTQGTLTGLNLSLGQAASKSAQHSILFRLVTIIGTEESCVVPSPRTQDFEWVMMDKTRFSIPDTHDGLLGAMLLFQAEEERRGGFPFLGPPTTWTNLQCLGLMKVDCPKLFLNSTKLGKGRGIAMIKKALEALQLTLKI
jgi:hypothetical protein